MSGKPVSFRPTKSDRERLEQFAEDEEIGTSTAATRAIDKGLEQLGYGPAGTTETALARYAWECAKPCLWFAFALAGAQIAVPAADFSIIVLGFLAAAMGLLGLRHAEPVLTMRLMSAHAGDDGNSEVAD